MAPAKSDNSRSRAAAHAARQAWRRGQAALRDGRTGDALRWLDRACRLAPADPLLRLGLATAWLRQDPAHAARLFAALTVRHATWESWFGLATARAQFGDDAGASAALAHGLRHFGAPDDPCWMALADRIIPGGWRRLHGAAPSQPTPIDPPAQPSPARRATRPPARCPAVRDPATPGRAIRGTDIIIPVFGDTAATRACLDSVLAARPRGTRIIVIDDASPEPDIVQALDRLAARKRILLIRHARNQGFPAAANAGLALARAAGNDVLLLNADTLVAPGFVQRLRQAAYAAADIGTACPLSNNATILSYPSPGTDNPMPDRAETARCAALAWVCNGGQTVDIPTAVGFCMFIRHDCLRATGRFRADLFGRGYGEENDFCARATASGWRHVAAPGVFVAHLGGASFGTKAAALRARNEEILARLHPAAAARIAAHVAADPLRPARERLDRARRRAMQPDSASAVLLITHAHGGGVAHSVAQSCASLRAAGHWPIVLAPTDPPDGSVGMEGFPNLRFHLPRDQGELLAVLRAARTERIEFHHTLGHPPQILTLPQALRLPYTVHVHDYHWLCPRVVLSATEGRYCGEPDLAGCDACIRKRGSRLPEKITVGDLRARSASLLGAAAQVIVPSTDAASRLGRYFPAIEPRVTRPAVPPFPPTMRAGNAGPLRIAVVGAIGPEKGFHILLALARDAAATGKGLEFVVIGHTTNDAALLRTRHVFITGPYDQQEAVALIRAQSADLALLPSVVPETWCHALTELWAAGLHVLAFDLGAQAERIRANGLGDLLPLGLPAAAINHALLAARW